MVQSVVKRLALGGPCIAVSLCRISQGS